MTDRPNDPWFDALPSCHAQVPCGPGWHTVRWQAGQLLLPEHPDAEAELVLAALGGEKAGCVRLAEAWGRHTSDLSVLAVGPRGPDDEITVGWPDVEAAGQRWGVRVMHSAGPALLALGPLASPPTLTGLRTRQEEAYAQAEQALHHGPGWGQAELTGHDDQRQLTVSLPPSWLARVWACGLALVSGHLVVATERASWPQARVLGLRAPGMDPIPLDVHDRSAEPDAPHWEV